LCSGKERHHIGEEDRGEAEQSEYDEEISNMIPNYTEVSFYLSIDTKIEKEPSSRESPEDMTCKTGYFDSSKQMGE
jgi:hypothetical protein